MLTRCKNKEKYLLNRKKWNSFNPARRSAWDFFYHKSLGGAFLEVSIAVFWALSKYF